MPTIAESAPKHRHGIAPGPTYTSIQRLSEFLFPN